MRCYICNKVLTENETIFNQDHGDYEPCTGCLEVIQDLVSSYYDKPSMDDDDFYEEVSLSELVQYITPSALEDFA